MGKRCIVDVCPFGYGDDRRFFRIPEPNKNFSWDGKTDLRTRWLEALGIPETRQLERGRWSNVCEIHFRPEDFWMNEKRKEFWKKRTAIPTLFLNLDPAEETLEEKVDYDDSLDYADLFHHEPIFDNCPQKEGRVPQIEEYLAQINSQTEHQPCFSNGQTGILNMQPMVSKCGKIFGYNELSNGPQMEGKPQLLSKSQIVQAHLSEPSLSNPTVRALVMALKSASGESTQAIGDPLSTLMQSEPEYRPPINGNKDYVWCGEDIHPSSRDTQIQTLKKLNKNLECQLTANKADFQQLWSRFKTQDKLIQGLLETKQSLEKRTVQLTTDIQKLLARNSKLVSLNHQLIQKINSHQQGTTTESWIITNNLQPPTYVNKIVSTTVCDESHSSEPPNDVPPIKRPRFQEINPPQSDESGNPESSESQNTETTEQHFTVEGQGSIIVNDGSGFTNDVVIKIKDESPADSVDPAFAIANTYKGPDDPPEVEAMDPLLDDGEMNTLIDDVQDESTRAQQDLSSDVGASTDPKKANLVESAVTKSPVAVVSATTSNSTPNTAANVNKDGVADDDDDVVALLHVEPKLKPETNTRQNSNILFKEQDGSKIFIKVPPNTENGGEINAKLQALCRKGSLQIESGSGSSANKGLTSQQNVLKSGPSSNEKRVVMINKEPFTFVNGKLIKVQKT